MTIFEEELLEPLARRFRFALGGKYLPTNKPLKIVDLGCGPRLRFYHYAKSRGIQIKNYIGIDPLVSPSVVKKQASADKKIIKNPLEKTIPLKTGSVDVVTAFAFLEHIDYPAEILAEAYRLLKPGGKLVFTTPTFRAQIVLEFLSFKLGLISPREIKEHKQYFDRNSLLKLLPKQLKLKQVIHQYFEFGMNNLLVVKK